MVLNEDFYDETMLTEMAQVSLPEYYNNDFYDVAVAIADQIIERFENIKHPETTTYKNQVTVRVYYDENIVFNGYGSLMECNNLKLDWLDTLSIIVSDQNLSDAEVIEDDFYVLLNKNSYTIDVAGEVTKHDVNFNVYRLDQRIPNYVRNEDNTVTSRATIVCVMNRRKKYSNTLIKNMLYHEITHLYHMHVYGKNSVGRPITNNYLSASKNAEYNTFIQRLNNIKTPETIKASVLSNISSEDFGDYLIMNREYFDFSEMNAYCYSFRGELDEAIKKYRINYIFPRNTKFESKEQQYQRLAMISDKFALFKSLRDVLQMAIKYVSSEEKEKFAKFDIKVYWGAYLGDNLGTLFGSDFKINNEYNKYSFDQMMLVVSDLIETECLEVCKNIYMDYFSYLEEKSLIEHKQNGYFKEGYIIPRKKYYYLDYYKISD